MKKIFILIGLLATFLSAKNVSGQSFHFTSDTVWATPVGTGVNVYNNVVNTSSDSIILTWKIIATDFPTDWIGYAGDPDNSIGICDNNLCYPYYALWNASTSTGTTYNSHKYAVGTGDFHLQSSLSAHPSLSNGTHYVTLRVNNQAVPTDTAIVTFVISKAAAAVGNVDKGTAAISLYPNPATNEVNLVYESYPDVTLIAVYNIIGKAMSVYRVNGNSANLNIENLPTGIYFARLMNAEGNILATRKFAKQ